MLAFISMRLLHHPSIYHCLNPRISTPALMVEWYIFLSVSLVPFCLALATFHFPASETAFQWKSNEKVAQKIGVYDVQHHANQFVDFSVYLNALNEFVHRDRANGRTLNIEQTKWAQIKFIIWMDGHEMKWENEKAKMKMKNEEKEEEEENKMK